MPDTPLLPRRILEVARDRFLDEPVLLLEGPRSVGKSTLLRQFAREHGSAVIDLDDRATREAVETDPALFMSGTSPVLVDEYQKVPSTLDAIKAELNRDHRPGRYALTGSTRAGALRDVQALTGRIHRLRIDPLSQGEIDGVTERFLEVVFDEPERLLQPTPAPRVRADVIGRLVRGGFPLALARRTDAARNRWFDDYLALTLERDVRELAAIRQEELLPRLLHRLAAQTGQVLNVSAAARDAGLEERTANAYTKLLEDVFLIRRLPAWGTTLLSRTQRSPKLHVVDSGLAARLLRLSEARLAVASPAALTELGHLLETFVVGELNKQASWSAEPFQLGHWRTTTGDEVDVVVERDDGAVVGIEVKASGRVPGAEFASLRRLQGKLGRSFVAGIVLHLGDRGYRIGDGLYVMPVPTLWSTVDHDRVGGVLPVPVSAGTPRTAPAVV